jgi:hypothetical protein
MKRAITAVFLAQCILVAARAQTEKRESTPARPPDPGQITERTCFQTQSPHWSPMLQLRSDVAICYGINPSLPARIAEWKNQGYITHVMTGVSWGNYQDYLYGRFDGVNHVDEAQTDRDGNVISHGGDIYYMSPGENFGKFLCRGVKQAMDGGAVAIHLEEPEFWARAGYSNGFKREWKAFYHEDWLPPHSSPDAQYRASYLKYYLYQRALKQVFGFVKSENIRTGRKVRCYVPTHSLINYAQWNIVSPESSLLRVGADGFVAQVWTGTARAPNVYQAVRRERTFETAFLEYGAMMNIVRASGKAVWFLNDPVEDDPNHSWEDYRANWESTLTASLLWPEVWRYEVMPWPERVFQGEYPALDAARRKPGEPVAHVPIPAAYATEIMTVITALNDMKQNEIAWDCGTRGIGVIVSDTMMFQREGPSPSETDLSSFYGLALPLLKHGVPIEPVQLENVVFPGGLASLKVLIMTYEGMKPMTSEVHSALATWVKNGGALVFLGDDSDPYNKVHAWWNDAEKKMNYDAPREHLFEGLGLGKSLSSGKFTAGKGTLFYDQRSPATLAYQKEGAGQIRELVRLACQSTASDYRETNYLLLRRGPYVIAAGLDESVSGEPKVLRGHFINLFDADLPIQSTVKLLPGTRYLLFDVDHPRAPGPSVLASACKVLGAEKTPDGAFRFYAEGPAKTEAVARIALSGPPNALTLDNNPFPPEARTWDGPTKTLLVRFPNSPSGHWITIR